MMRVLVTGSRDWADVDAIDLALSAISSNVDDDIVIVHGACPTGADAHAAAWVVERNEMGDPTITAEPHPADWSLGRRAGPVRNNEMIALGADACLAFISACTSPRCRRTDEHFSHGATGCADAAEKAGIRTIRILADRTVV